MNRKDAEELTIASVEIVTPGGVTKSDALRIAARQPSHKLMFFSEMYHGCT